MRNPRKSSLAAALVSLLFLYMAPLPAETKQVPASQPAAVTGHNTSKPELHPGGLDVILLLDKSLSMAPFFAEVKAYAAGEVLGAILAPGDRLIIELVYGKVERLFSGSIDSEQDKARAIRMLREVKADGRYTDLGKGLDAAEHNLKELGAPERPKYVLMLTDERQEAPPGSPYTATNYRLSHPALEYVVRKDLGKFKAMTIGLQVGSKIESTAPEFMRLLSEPPLRSRDGSTLLMDVSDTAGDKRGQSPDSTAAANQGGSSRGPDPELGGFSAFLGGRALPFVVALLALLIAAGVFVLARTRRRDDSAKAGQRRL